ncbi:MAG: ABC transporter ATP-binding protein [Chloroflexi bacterium]|nr:ABC transporter ATP-binding protein [Chloroflexota bacterium]
MPQLVRLLGFVLAQRRGLLALIALGVVVAAANVGQALLLATMLGHILGGQPWGVILPLILAAALLLAVRALSLGATERLGASMAACIKADVRRRLFAHLVDLGPGWLGRTRTGLVQTVLVDSVELLEKYFSIIVPRAIVAVLTLIPLLVVVAALDGLVGLIVAVCAVVALITPPLSSHLLRARTRFWMEQYAPLTAEYLDSVQGMATLKAFNASGRHGAQLLSQANAVRDAATGLVIFETLYTGVAGLAIATGTALAVGVGALHVAGGTLSVGALLLILLLVSQCFAPVRSLQQAFHYAYYAPEVGQKIFDILDAVPPVAEPPTSRNRPAAAPGLAFEEVRFAYRPEAQPALSGVSFTIAPGETVALVGRSGAGKTTVVSLLLRFFDPQHGRVTLGDHDLRELRLADLRAQIAVVSQDTYLFHGTIRENLLLAKPDASEAELEATARAAAVHDFVVALPDGYDTVVGERGLKLSGGERQRVAIARALLKNAPVLILDEATASVDLANETTIQRALERAMHGRTTLVIAHRLSTVRHADRIIVLEAGRVIEAGTPAELLHRQGAYARMVAVQGGGM